MRAGSGNSRVGGTNEKRVEKGHRENEVGSKNLPIMVANLAGEVIGKVNYLEQRDNEVRGRNEDEGGIVQRERIGNTQGGDEGRVRQGEIIRLRDGIEERKGEEGGYTVMEKSMCTKHPECDTKECSGVKVCCQSACKQDREELEQEALQRIPLLECTNRVASSEKGVLQVGSSSNKKL